MTPESPKLRGLVVLAVVFFVHEALLSGLRIDGVRPDLLLGLAMVSAIVGGPATGAGAGFVCGLVADLFVNTPFGLTALVFCLVGFLVGSIQQALGPGARGIVPGLTLVASATAVVIWAALGTVLGLPGLLRPHLLVIAAVIAIVNAIGSVPLRRIVQWVFDGVARPGGVARAARGLAG